MGATVDLAFVTCIERGFLEEQSLLLYQSIRRFGGRYSNATIYAYCPRASCGVTSSTATAMQALEVIYRYEPLNRNLDYFAYANKNFAIAHVERTASHDTLVLLDSDTLFLREPDLFDLPRGVDVRVRPVDLKNISSSGQGDSFDSYWCELAKLCRVDLEKLPFIRCTLGGTVIRANYNGGLVVARANLGIFRRWEQNILAVHEAQLRPRPNDLWGSGQSTLAMAIHSATSQVEQLPPSYNYPLHLHEKLDATQQIGGSAEIVHLHYHWMFERGIWEDSAMAKPEFRWEPAIRDWLSARIPLARRESESPKAPATKRPTPSMRHLFRCR